MDARTRRGLQVLRNMRVYLPSADVSPAIGPVEKHVQGLDELIGRLSAHAVEQDASDRVIRILTREAREQLNFLRLELMRPVERLGKALFVNDESVKAGLALPVSNSYESVIAGAQAMARLAAERRDRFVTAGFSADFPERLTAAAQKLEQTLDAKGAQVGRRAAATAALREEFAQARDLVRLLDSMVARPLSAVPGRLAEWRSVSRFARQATGKDEDDGNGTSPEPQPTETPLTASPSGLPETTERDHAA